MKLNPEHKKYIKEIPGQANKHILFVSIALIICLGFVVYANSLNGNFIWDDRYLVKDNVYIKSFSYLPKLFSEDIGAGGAKKYNFYRPLQMLTYMLDYSF